MPAEPQPFPENVVEMMKAEGYDGAVWVDTYRRCFRDAMPPTKCGLPETVQAVYDRIVSINGRRGGCWDVMAWKGDEVYFIECKRRGKDQMRDSGRSWHAAALKAGIPAERMTVCEWDMTDKHCPETGSGVNSQP